MIPSENLILANAFYAEVQSEASQLCLLYGREVKY